jgi:hypothetical protein
MCHRSVAAEHGERSAGRVLRRDVADGTPIMKDLPIARNLDRQRQEIDFGFHVSRSNARQLGTHDGDEHAKALRQALADLARRPHVHQAA